MNSRTTTLKTTGTYQAGNYSIATGDSCLNFDAEAQEEPLAVCRELDKKNSKVPFGGKRRFTAKAVRKSHCLPVSADLTIGPNPPSARQSPAHQKPTHACHELLDPAPVIQSPNAVLRRIPDYHCSDKVSYPPIQSCLEGGMSFTMGLVTSESGLGSESATIPRDATL